MGYAFRRWFQKRRSWSTLLQPRINPRSGLTVGMAISVAMSNFSLGSPATDSTWVSVPLLMSCSTNLLQDGVFPQLISMGASRANSRQTSRRYHWLRPTTSKDKLITRWNTGCAQACRVCVDSGILGVCSGGLITASPHTSLRWLLTYKQQICFWGWPWSTWHPHQSSFACFIGFTPVIIMREHSNLQI